MTYREALTVFSQGSPTVRVERAAGGLCCGRGDLASYRQIVVQLMCSLLTEVSCLTRSPCSLVAHR